MSEMIEKMPLAEMKQEEQIGASVIDDNYLSVIGDMALQVSVEIGQATMTINSLRQLKINQVVQLDKNVNEAVTLTLNDKPIATGELVVSGDRFAILIKQLLLER